LSGEGESKPGRVEAYLITLMPLIENRGGDVKVIVTMKVWRKVKEIAFIGVPAYLRIFLLDLPR
jgi:hypothetical protein